MSESATARPPAKPGQGKTYLGLTRQQLYIVGGVFVVVLGYLLWRRHQAAAAAGSQAPASAGSNECTDANGNPVDCGELTAQELAALQNQLDQLQANGSSGSGGGYGTNGSGSVTGSTTPTDTTNPSPNTPTTSTGGTTATATRAGAISNLQAYNVKTTSALVKWNPAANASQGYYYKVTTVSGGQTVRSGNTKSTSVSLAGLKPKTEYNFGVQGLPGGPGDNIHFTTT